MGDTIEVIINGILESLQKDISVSDLLELKKIEPAKVVVEINKDIVKREQYSSHILHDNDRIEILRFVGGG